MDTMSQQLIVGQYHFPVTESSWTFLSPSAIFADLIDRNMRCRPKQTLLNFASDVQVR